MPFKGQGDEILDEIILLIGMMLMVEKRKLVLKQKTAMTYDGSVKSYEEEGNLEIDLCYNDEYGDACNNDSDEPLDLSMNGMSRIVDVKRAKLPTTDIQLPFNFSVFENNNERVTQYDNKDKTMTEEEVSFLLDPYVKNIHKKFFCTVCDMKFASKVKAVAHVENKHVDCLQYKCPLCRASKGTRLAYESHLRRGHGAKVNQYSPHIRCKKQFLVKSEAQSSKIETETGQPYDLQFVTFLRHILSMGKEVNHTKNNFQERIMPCAHWVDKEQSIFIISNRHEFSRRWYKFKVNYFPLYIIEHTTYIYFLVAGC